MRFDSARAAGLDEERVGRIADGYETALEPAQVAALKLTDAIIGIPRPPVDEVRQALRAHYSEAEIAEIAMGVGLFLGMSKVLINLGLEPEDMPITLVPTPE
ncbi:MAG: hypothetical protein OXF68_11085 [Gammaproteobacteria bacterium]|nr:hypothetical protein [Gammaproteobacteria bacterium]MCY4343329.1 hypothetical protein [Gammaproteobacteria bacterium]